MSIRNRIKEHRRVRAGELLPHEMNWRTHPESQQAALRALYQEIGFARSLLAFETPDGRLKLIDGHLRRDIDPDMLVDVEILDVTEEEARKLLLSIDPLATLAAGDAETLAKLKQRVETDSKSIQELWDQLLAKNEPCQPELPFPDPDEKEESTRTLSEQYLILVECGNEARQIELLQKFQSEGLTCRALVS